MPVSRRSFLTGLSATTALSLAGCSAIQNQIGPHHHWKDAPLEGPKAPWPTLGANAQRTGFRPDSKGPSSEARAEAIADGGTYSRMQPAVGSDSIVFGVDRRTQGGETFSGFIAMDETGKEQWRVKEDQGMASPTIVGNTVFTTSAGETRAIDRRDGSLCWQYDVGYGSAECSPTVVGGTVYVTGKPLVALNARTGEKQWEADQSFEGIQGTAATEELVCATTGSGGDGGLYGLNPTDGTVQWESSEIGESYTNPVLGGEFVYVVETSGQLKALDRSTGELIWMKNLGGQSYIPPAVDTDTVYVAGTNGERLYALDSATGEERWTFDFEVKYVPSPPTVGQDTVFLPLGNDSESLLVALDAETGEQKAQWTLSHEPSAGLTVGDDFAVLNCGENPSRTKVYVIQ